MSPENSSPDSIPASAAANGPAAAQDAPVAGQSATEKFTGAADSVASASASVAGSAGAAGIAGAAGVAGVAGSVNGTAAALPGGAPDALAHAAKIVQVIQQIVTIGPDVLSRLRSTDGAGRPGWKTSEAWLFFVGFLCTLAAGLSGLVRPEVATLVSSALAVAYGILRLACKRTQAAREGDALSDVTLLASTATEALKAYAAFQALRGGSGSVTVSVSAPQPADPFSESPAGEAGSCTGEPGAGLHSPAPGNGGKASASTLGLLLAALLGVCGFSGCALAERYYVAGVGASVSKEGNATTGAVNVRFRPNPYAYKAVKPIAVQK